ncbi:MAG: hypothetical protein V3U84_05945 [Thiotrichaceae bacterium]
MTSYGKHGSQKNQLLPTHRAFFNYGNAGEIGGYNSFFSGTADGGDIVPENTLVLTNDNSKLHFAANFDSGFDTLHDWTCVFDNAVSSEDRNTSESSANGALLANLSTSSLGMSVAANGTVRSTIILESKNYLKMPESGRTYLEMQGVFEHIGAPTINPTVFSLFESGIGPVTQTSWNIDTFLSGELNPSGIILDFTKVQTAVFEYTGKNKGNVRFGFLIGHTIYFAHEFAINNSVDNTKTLNLPIRDGITVESTTSVSRAAGLYNTTSGYFFRSTMNTTSDPMLLVEQKLNSVVCYTIGADAVEKKVPFAAGNKDTFINVTTANTPLFSIQCDSTFSGVANRTVFNLDHLNIISSSQDENFGCDISVLYNTDLTTGTAPNFVPLPGNSQSALQYDVTADAVSGGIEIFSTQIMANEKSTFSMEDILKNYRKEISRNDIVGLNVTSKVLTQTLTVVASPMQGVFPTTTIDVSANIFGGEVG